MVSKTERKRDKRRRVDDANQAARPEPKPEWVSAFMIAALHKLGGKLTLSFDDLKRFEEMTCNKQTSLDYDDINRTVTIQAPEYKVPEKSVIIHEKGIVTN